MNATDRYDSLIKWYAMWARLPGEHIRFTRRVQMLDWTLLKRMLIAESSMNPDAQSAVGAVGLAQAMPETWNEWAGKQKALRNRRDPEHSISFMADYLTWLLSRTNNDVRQALSAYNWGIGKVITAIKTYGADWESALPDATAAYLARILPAEVVETASESA